MALLVLPKANVAFGLLLLLAALGVSGCHPENAAVERAEGPAPTPAASPPVQANLADASLPETLTAARPCAGCPEIDIAIHEFRSIPLPPATGNYKVGDGKVVSVRTAMEGNLFLLVGEKAGTTTFAVVAKDGSVTT